MRDLSHMGLPFLKKLSDPTNIWVGLHSYEIRFFENGPQTTLKIFSLSFYWRAPNSLYIHYYSLKFWSFIRNPSGETYQLFVVVFPTGEEWMPTWINLEESNGQEWSPSKSFYKIRISIFIITTNFSTMAFHSAWK